MSATKSEAPKHSPLPWSSDNYRGLDRKHTVIISSGIAIGRITGFSESNTEFIIEACNNYERRCDELKRSAKVVCDMAKQLERVKQERDQQERFKWEANSRADKAEQQRDELLAALKALAHAIPNGEHLADMVPELDQAEAAIANVEGKQMSATKSEAPQMDAKTFDQAHGLREQERRFILLPKEPEPDIERDDEPESLYSLLDEGRSDGHGESYAERNT